MISSHVRRCAALCALFVATAALSDNPPATSGPATPVKRVPAEEDRIQQALDSRQPFECKDLLISDLPAFLQKKYGIPAVLDTVKIDEAGKKESTVSLSTKGASLRACLNIMLSPHELAYKIADEALVITTRDKELDSLTTEVLPVGHLTASRNQGACELVYDEGHDWDEDSLVEILTANVFATSWDQAGGPGSARVFRDLLVVSQRHEVLDEVKKLLAALDIAKKLDRGGSTETTAIDSDDSLTKSLRAALDRKARLSITDQPLEDVIGQLAKFHDLPFLFDRFELEHAGKEPSELVLSINLADVSLRSLLRQLLTPHDLAVVIRNEHIVVTTKEVASATLTTRVYPVRDLVTLDTVVQTGSLDFEWLKEVVTTTVQPPSWDAAGGSGTVRELDRVGALVISQTSDIHEEIAQLLTRLRQVRQQQAGAKKPANPAADTSMIVRFYKIDLSRDAPAKSDFPPGEAKPAPSSAADVASLIRDLIEPESWKKEQEAYLRAIGDRLVVRHRRAVHRQIERLIEKLIAAPTPTPTDNQIPMVTGAAF